MCTTVSMPRLIFILRDTVEADSLAPELLQCFLSNRTGRAASVTFLFWIALHFEVLWRSIPSHNIHVNITDLVPTYRSLTNLNVTTWRALTCLQEIRLFVKTSGYELRSGRRVTLKKFIWKTHRSFNQNSERPWHLHTMQGPQMTHSKFSVLKKSHPSLLIRNLSIRRFILWSFLRWMTVIWKIVFGL